MSKGLETRTVILDESLQLASRIGFEALTIGHLAEQTGMSKSGLFAHFKSKEQLQLQTLDHSRQLFVDTVIRPTLTTPRGVKRVEALFDNWLVREHVLQGGCIFVTGAAEYDDQPGPMRDALVRNQRDWIESIATVAALPLLFSGFTPLFAGAVGLALTIVLILGLAIAANVPVVGLRVLFWVGLALLCAISIWLSVAVVLLIVLALMIPAALSGRGREALIACRWALADGARQALSVGLACALVGVIIGTMTLTGLGTIVGNAVVSIGEHNLFYALFLTMVFSLILGMGIPTIPNYIITSTLAAPILLHLGVPLIVSHMFVFYFGIMADLTPPVALAAFAAAPMAKESGLKIAIQAVRIALPGFLVPYMAVTDPILMLQPVPGVDGIAYWLAAALVIGKAVLAIGLWGVAAFGYLNGPVGWLERLLAGGIAVLLVFPSTATDIAGFVLAALFALWRVMAARRVRRQKSADM